MSDEILKDDKEIAEPVLDESEELYEDGSEEILEGQEHEEQEITLAEEPPATFAAKLSSFIEKIKLFGKDFYEANFKSDDEGPSKKRGKIDDSPDGLRSSSQQKMGRAVNAVLDKPTSATKGGPTRQKVKPVTSKSYKPELNRF